MMRVYVAQRWPSGPDDPEGVLLVGSDRGAVVEAAKEKLCGAPCGTNCESYAWKEHGDIYEMVGIVMTNGKTMPINSGMAFDVEGHEWIG